MNKTTNNRMRRTHHNDVVDIDQEIHGDVRTTKHKEGGVSTRRNKAMIPKNTPKASMPGTGHLFKPIEGFDQTTEMLRMSRINKPRRLTHVDLLLKNTMEESILNIKLPNMPTTCDRKREQKSNGGGLNDRTESVFVVQSIALFESLGNQTRFVALRPVRVTLDLKDPLRVNDIDTRTRRNQPPGLIAKEGLILSLHRLTPVRYAHSIMMRSRLRAWIGDAMSGTCRQPGDRPIGPDLGTRVAGAATSDWPRW
jgi:hypothetical protein